MSQSSAGFSGDWDDDYEDLDVYEVQNDDLTALDAAIGDHFARCFGCLYCDEVEEEYDTTRDHVLLDPTALDLHDFHQLEQIGSVDVPI